MKFIVNSSNPETYFSELKNPVAFLDSIKKRKTLIEEARYKQQEFNRYLKKIRIGNKYTLAIKQKLFNRRNDAMKFVDDCGSMILEAKEKAARKEPQTKPSKAKTKHEKFINEQIFKEKFINEIKNEEKKKLANI